MCFEKSRHSKLLESKTLSILTVFPSAEVFCNESEEWTFGSTKTSWQQKSPHQSLFCSDVSAGVLSLFRGIPEPHPNSRLCDSVSWDRNWLWKLCQLKSLEGNRLVALLIFAPWSLCEIVFLYDNSIFVLWDYCVVSSALVVLFKKKRKALTK